MVELTNLVLQELEKIQTIPAPTFDEINRSQYIYQTFLAQGLSQVDMDGIGNVYGFLAAGGGKPVVLSAHMDTVHAKNVDHSIRKENQRWFGPGIGDNSLSLAALIGLIHHFQNQTAQIAGGIWFVANVGEEGLGNLAGMREVTDRFKSETQAFIVLEGIGLGGIFHKALGLKRYELQVSTAGGHAWANYGNPSAIDELAKFITAAKKITGSEKGGVSLNFGNISGGTTINSIANYADCRFEVRALNEELLNHTLKKIDRIVKKTSRPEVEYSLKEIGSRPFGSLGEDHWLLRKAMNALKELNILPYLLTGSTDASEPLSRGFPSVCICLTRGGNIHTSNEFIELGPIESGLRQVIYLVNHLWDG